MDHHKLWKILQEMGMPDHPICLLGNLYAGQEATVRTGRGTTDWFQIGKRVCQGCILSPCLFNLYAEYILRNVNADQKAIVRTRHGTTDKGVHQSCILSPCLFNVYAVYIKRNAGLEEAQAGDRKSVV